MNDTRKIRNIVVALGLAAVALALFISTFFLIV